MPEVFKQGLVYVIGDDPILVDLPEYKGFSNVKRILLQQNQNPCPASIYLTTDKLGVYSKNGEDVGKFFLMLTSTSDTFSDT